MRLSQRGNTGVVPSNRKIRLVGTIRLAQHMSEEHRLSDDGCVVNPDAAILTPARGRTSVLSFDPIAFGE